MLVKCSWTFLCIDLFLYFFTLQVSSMSSQLLWKGSKEAEVGKRMRRNLGSDRRWRNLWLQPISAKYLSLLRSPQLQHSELLLCMWVYFCFHLSFSEEAGLMHFRENDWYPVSPFIVLERTVSAVSTFLFFSIFLLFT